MKNNIVTVYYTVCTRRFDLEMRLMCQAVTSDDPRRSRLLEELARDPVGYRHVYGPLDPEYHDLADRRRAHELFFLEDRPVLMWTAENVATIWGEHDETTGEAVAQFLLRHQLNEVTVLGDEPLGALHPILTDGEWRLSRNYGVVAQQFRPRPLSAVRPLDRADEAALERACKNVEVLGASASTRRDFGFMKQGLPVLCYGAFVDEELVGFCSSNPICRGVQEISWIAVAPEFRRQGFAAALLTAQATEAFAHGTVVGYHAGSAGDDLHALVSKLGFRQTLSTYRFVPRWSEERWRLSWGRRV